MAMSEPNKLTCPGCGVELTAVARAAYSPEVMTIVYQMEPGRKMSVEDYCKSLGALAKSLKLLGKEAGANLFVGLESVTVSDGEVSTSIAVIEAQK